MAELAEATELLTISQAARLVGIPSRTLRRYAARGDLPALRPGGQYLLRRDDLTRFVVRSIVGPESQGG